jgi:hypothetical protein
MQKFLSLIITAAILYLIIQMKLDDKPKIPEEQKVVAPIANSKQDSATAPQENQPLTGNFIEKALSSVLINVLKTEEGKMFFENILQPMNKPIAGANDSFKINNTDLIKSMLKINSFGEGTVGPASCGHIVTVHYQILTMNNNVVEEQTKTYALGSRAVIPGLDNVIVGMMVGQTRQALIPAKYAYYEGKYRKPGINPEDSYKVNVALQSILPNNFVKNNKVKIFDDEVSYQMPLTCGDRVIFNARITKLANGKVLYDSSTLEKIKMKIGDMNYPLIFSHALYSKIPVGTRTVIAEGKSFQALAARISKIFPKDQLPESEYFMLELTDIKAE